MEALTVRRVPSSSDLAKRGDYVFVPKREPIRRYEQVEGSPQGSWAPVHWVLSGLKPLVKEVLEALWPDYDDTIINCRGATSRVPRAKTA